MNIEVNYTGVAVATMASMVLGAFWYAPAVFGNVWRSILKLKESDMKVAEKKSILIMLLSSLIMAYVLYHSSYLSYSYYKNSWMTSCLQTAFWVGIGYQVFRTVARDSFELRRKKITLINIGNDFATIMLMGLVLGLFGV